MSEPNEPTKATEPTGNPAETGAEALIRRRLQIPDSLSEAPDCFTEPGEEYKGNANAKAKANANAKAKTKTKTKTKTKENTKDKE